MIPLINLREIDKKRLRNLKDRTETNLKSEDIWFVHTVLAQCFLPYHDPKTERWHKKNGAFSILLTAGAIEDKESFRVLGLPFGAKPRLFQSYICTQAIKHQSPVIPVEPSMTAMLVELGYDAYSTPKLPLIPRQSCHLFHTKAATDSIASLPPIPGEACR